MIERFRSNRFSKEKLELLKKISVIIEEYKQQRIRLTLRQLYYQLVSRDIIANSTKEYSKLSTLVTTARYNGLIDWDAIEDRIRVPRRHAQFNNILDLVKAAKSSYRLDRWKGQDYYVELFTEKDALASILKPIADQWHIFFCVNRGYSSATAIYDTAKRIEKELGLDGSSMEMADAEGEEAEGRKAIVLYLGDHDPSGLDMVRDMRERIVEILMGDVTDEEEYFIERRRAYIESKVEVLHIALTTAQVNKYKPPPNPAKISDPRAGWYIKNYGKTSWEVDALRPEVMISLVNDAVVQYVDVEKMNAVIEQEVKTIKPIEDLASKLAKKYNGDETNGED